MMAKVSDAASSGLVVGPLAAVRSLWKLFVDEALPVGGPSVLVLALR